VVIGTAIDKISNHYSMSILKRWQQIFAILVPLLLDGNIVLVIKNILRIRPISFSARCHWKVFDHYVNTFYLFVCVWKKVSYFPSFHYYNFCLNYISINITLKAKRKDRGFILYQRKRQCIILIWHYCSISSISIQHINYFYP